METPIKSHGFPSMPDYRALWAPVYMEPIVGSGERLTVGIIAQSRTETVAIQAISTKVVRCLYGEQSANFLGLVSMLLDDIRHSLDDQAIVDIGPSFQGCFIGDIREAAADNMTGIIHQAKKLCSSLSLLETEALTIEEDNRDQVVANDELTRKIMRNTPDNYYSFFNQSIQLVKGGKYTRFGFLNDHYAAQFSVMKPNRTSMTIKDVQSKLVELRMAKTYQMHVSKADIYLYLPDENSPMFTDKQFKSAKEAFNILQEEAHEMIDRDIISIHSINEGANKLIEEAA